MRVRIFQGHDYEGIRQLEDAINRWLAGDEFDGHRVVKTELVAATNSEHSGSSSPSVISFVWYEAEPF